MKRLKDLREDHDLTQTDVAKILGISQQYYQCYESGKNEILVRHCVALAKYYGVSLDYIVGLSNLPYTKQREFDALLEKYASLIKHWETAEPQIKRAIRILLQYEE